MTITEFLEARIAEDERNNDADVDPAEWCDRVAGTHYEHDRIAAECAAKRAIIARIPQLTDPFRPTYYTGSSALQILAAIYSDHPDYDKEWAL